MKALFQLASAIVLFFALFFSLFFVTAISLIALLLDKKTTQDESFSNLCVVQGYAYAPAHA